MDTLPYPEPCLGQANGENAVTKKAIFLKIRCGRCHAGAGSAGAGITKTDRTLGIFSFQASPKVSPLGPLVVVGGSDVPLGEYT